MNSRSVYLYDFLKKKNWIEIRCNPKFVCIKHSQFCRCQQPPVNKQRHGFNTKLVIWWSGYKAKHHNFQKHLKHVYVRCWLHFFQVCLFFFSLHFLVEKRFFLVHLTFTNALTRNFFPCLDQDCTFFFFFRFASGKWISWKIYAKERTQKRRTIDARMHSTTKKLALRTNDDDTFKIY